MKIKMSFEQKYAVRLRMISFYSTKTLLKFPYLNVLKEFNVVILQ